jgi:SAM domain (Sterile alpha motif)
VALLAFEKRAKQKKQNKKVEENLRKKKMLSNVLRSIVNDLNRSEADYERVCALLSDQWVVSLQDWATLSASNRDKINLPLLVRVALDERVKQRDVADYSGGIISLYRVDRSRLIFRFPQTNKRKRKSNNGTHKKKNNAENDDSLVFEFEADAPLAMLLVALGGNAKLYESEERVREVDPRTPLWDAIVCDGQRALCVSRGLFIFSCTNVGGGGSQCAIDMDSYESCVEHWLDSMLVRRLYGRFVCADVDDFFALPFLSEAALLDMGVADADDRRRVMAGVRRLRRLRADEFVRMWLHHMRYDELQAAFERERIDLLALLALTDDDLARLGISSPTSGRYARLCAAIVAYKRFASVDETFRWLRASGFDKHGFHFARFNIPLYSLPYVNFFTAAEVGTRDDRAMIAALVRLKRSVAFRVKAVAYWLRDLEMESYSLVFVNAHLVDLASLAELSESAIRLLVPSATDRDKLRAGIAEMKEFKFYFAATKSLLRDVNLSRHVGLLAKHSISIDVLPVLTEPQLVKMGVAEPAERRTILGVVAKVQKFIPVASAGLRQHRIDTHGYDYDERRSSGCASSSSSAAAAAAAASDDALVPLRRTSAVGTPIASAPWNRYDDILFSSAVAAIDESSYERSERDREHSARKASKAAPIRRQAAKRRGRSASSNADRQTAELRAERANRTVEEWLDFINQADKQFEEHHHRLQQASGDSGNNDDDDDAGQQARSPISSALFAAEQKRKEKKKKKKEKRSSSRPRSMSHRARQKLELAKRRQAKRDAFESASEPKPVSVTLKVDEGSAKTLEQQQVSADEQQPRITTSTDFEKLYAHFNSNNGLLGSASSSDDELDEELKKQLDREVDAFRRRLEEASCPTKSQLAPIFYLPD